MVVDRMEIITKTCRMFLTSETNITLGVSECAKEVYVNKIAAVGCTFGCGGSFQPVVLVALSGQFTCGVTYLQEATLEAVAVAVRLKVRLKVKEFLYVNIKTYAFIILLCIAEVMLGYKSLKGTVKVTALTPKQIQIQQLRAWIVTRNSNGARDWNMHRSFRIQKKQKKLDLLLYSNG